MRLTDRVALVTGAGQGIGRAIVLAFAGEGADVIVADIARDPAEQVAAAARQLGVRAMSVFMDVSVKAQVEQAVAQGEGSFGPIDILVNNAGITRDAMFHKMTEEQFDEVIAIHLKGTWLCSQAVVQGMRERRYGKIINMSSITGKVGNIGQTNYCAAKAGIIGFTKALAKELAGHKINVNAIMPGFIDTAMTRAIPEDLRRQKVIDIPLGNIGRPADIARAAVFLASDESSFMTGGVIEVAGGLFM